MAVRTAVVVGDGSEPLFLVALDLTSVAPSAHVAGGLGGGRGRGNPLCKPLL